MKNNETQNETKESCVILFRCRDGTRMTQKKEKTGQNIHHGEMDNDRLNQNDKIISKSYGENSADLCVDNTQHTMQKVTRDRVIMLILTCCVSVSSANLIFLFGGVPLSLSLS